MNKSQCPADASVNHSQICPVDTQDNPCQDCSTESPKVTCQGIPKCITNAPPQECFMNLPPTSCQKKPKNLPPNHSEECDDQCQTDTVQECPIDVRSVPCQTCDDDDEVKAKKLQRPFWADLCKSLRFSGDAWLKFRLLMWKNFLQQWRRRGQTVAEILLPVLTMTLVLLIRWQVPPSYQDISIYPPLRAYSMDSSMEILAGMNSENFSIAYSPKSPILQEIVLSALAALIDENPTFQQMLYSSYIKGQSPIRRKPRRRGRSGISDLYSMLLDEYMTNTSHLRAYNSSSELRSLYATEETTRVVLAAVEFDDELFDAKELPAGNLSYSLRFPERPRLNSFYQTGGRYWRTDLIFPTYELPGPRFQYSWEGGNDPGYVNELFIALQHAVSMELISRMADQNMRDTFEVFIQRYPYPAYWQDLSLTVLKFLFPMFIMLSCSYTAINIVRAIVVEKELQLKETMKIMGLPTWLHWSAWFWKQFLFQLLIAVLMIILLKVHWFINAEGFSNYAVFTHTPWTVLFFFLLLYLTSIIFFCFMLSGFFSKGSSAALFTGVIWFLSYMPSIALSSDVEMSIAMQIISCLIINIAMSFGFQLLLARESAGGIQWGQFLTSPTAESSRFLFGHVVFMLLFDCVFYMLITLYLEQISPGPFGAPRPWYFPFQRKFWCPDRKSGYLNTTAVEKVTPAASLMNPAELPKRLAKRSKSPSKRSTCNDNNPSPAEHLTTPAKRYKRSSKCSTTSAEHPTRPAEHSTIPAECPVNPTERSTCPAESSTCPAEHSTSPAKGPTIATVYTTVPCDSNDVTQLSNDKSNSPTVPSINSQRYKKSQFSVELSVGSNCNEKSKSHTASGIDLQSSKSSKSCNVTAIGSQSNGKLRSYSTIGTDSQRVEKSKSSTLPGTDSQINGKPRSCTVLGINVQPGVNPQSNNKLKLVSRYNPQCNVFFTTIIQVYKAAVNVIQKKDVQPEVYEDKIIHEKDPENHTIGVKMQNLTKIFGHNTVVDNLSLNIYNDQITVLLGHNGAGKSTTISMLTGNLEATHGIVNVAGFDMATQAASARSHIGLCPQHNVLFNELTVREHLEFFSRLKGLTGKELEADIDTLIKKLELVPKRDYLSQGLSGGQKRRLCVGIALSGGAKVVLLDEPTSGMDPASRRGLWDLLQKEKKGRSMILTTHFMDEADILGDRVAIMAKGRLQCVGSPFFLKRHYGVGYTLVVVKGQNYDVERCTALLNKYIPGTVVKEDTGSEVTYNLPNEYSNKFEEMLTDLERNIDTIKFQSYGLTTTTLEDVFMRVGADLAPVDPNKKTADVETEEIDSSIAQFDRPKSSVTGGALLIQRIVSVWLKLVLISTRSWWLLILQFIVPIILLNVSLGMLEYVLSLVPTIKKRMLKLTQGFAQTETFLACDSNLTVNVLASEAYQEMFEKSGVQNMKLTNIENKHMAQYYLNRTSDPVVMGILRHSVLTGATFSDFTVTAWFSNFGFHDVAISLAAMHSALLKSIKPTLDLTVYNYPLEANYVDQTDMQMMISMISMQLATGIGSGLAIMMAVNVIFYIKERVSGAKLLQKSAGLQPVVMWGSAAVFDWFWFLVFCLPMPMSFMIFKVAGLSSGIEIFRLYVCLMVYGAAMMPLTYLLSHVFDGPAFGFVCYFFLNVVLGMLGSQVVEALMSPDFDAKSTADALDSVLQFHPLYSLVTSIRSLNQIGLREKRCYRMCEYYQVIYPDFQCNLEALCEADDSCCTPENSQFRWAEPGVLRYLVVMTFTSLLMWSILMFIEYRLMKKIWARKTVPPPVDKKKLDEDVVAEMKRAQDVYKTNQTQQALLALGLSKYFGKYLAVNQISFCVNDGECFGLLGVNGAGKTTTFKMLMGDESISSGQAFVSGHSVEKSLHKVHENIGYCPQFDALFMELTGRETMRIFALMRGLRPQSVNTITDAFARALGFQIHLDKRVHQYSGGNRRKLNTAVAFLGKTRLVFVDEPTTGVDPAARRHVWRAVRGVQRAGRGVVLTSHSMEECEALCSRLTIMVNGGFRCFGTPQHLKIKFSEGFTLNIKMKTDDNGSPGIASVARLKDYINLHFIHPKIMEEYQGQLTYYLPDRTVAWSKMFGIMERSKQECDVEDYTIAQTTLEQIFLQFTKYQGQNDPIETEKTTKLSEHAEDTTEDMQKVSSPKQKTSQMIVQQISQTSQNIANRMEITSAESFVSTKSFRRSQDSLKEGIDKSGSSQKSTSSMQRSSPINSLGPNHIWPCSEPTQNPTQGSSLAICLDSLDTSVPRPDTIDPIQSVLMKSLDTEQITPKTEKLPKISEQSKDEADAIQEISTPMHKSSRTIVQQISQASHNIANKMKRTSSKLLLSTKLFGRIQDPLKEGYKSGPSQKSTSSMQWSSPMNSLDPNHIWPYGEPIQNTIKESPPIKKSDFMKFLDTEQIISLPTIKSATPIPRIPSTKPLDSESAHNQCNINGNISSPTILIGTKSESILNPDSPNQQTLSQKEFRTSNIEEPAQNSATISSRVSDMVQSASAAIQKPLDLLMKFVKLPSPK